MKKYLLLTLIFISVLSFSPLVAQKVTVSLNRSKESSLTFWQILNENSSEIVSANSYLNEDSVSFSLEANKLYSLRIIISDPGVPSLIAYTLGVDGRIILRISEQSKEGELEYKFFTGVKIIDSKIVGGSNALISDFPWQVLFKTGKYLCGATIIAPGWVLTAAHCTEDGNNNTVPISDMTLIAGTATPFIQGHGFTYHVSQVIKHEEYNRTTLENDIALLKLVETVNTSNSAPIKLISQVDVNDGCTAPGVMSWLTGWGYISVSPPAAASTLQMANLPIVSNDQAEEIWGTIPSTDLMAGYLSGNMDACNGDSGGPLIVPVSGEYKLAGIVSWGSTSCDTYSGFTRVSDFLGWINSNTGIVDFRPAVPSGNALICHLSDTASYDVDPYPSASNYEWKLFPEAAGIISANSTKAKVIWNQSYTGSVQVMVRTTVNKSVSDWSKLKVMLVPEIKLLTSFNDVALCANTPLTMGPTAEGYNLRYNWYRNNTLIQSSTSNIVSIKSLNSSNSGIYKYVISDGCGSTLSGNINLNVLPVTAIKNIPAKIEVPIGSSPLLEISVEGTDLKYQWEKDGRIIPDGIDPALRLYDINTKDIGIYRVSLSGTCGSLTSDSMYVYVGSEISTGSVEVLVWPTVTLSEFNIAINNEDTYTVQLFNTNGSIIKELKDCRYQTKMYVGTLPRGIYIMNVYNSGFRKSIKVIKN